MAVAEAEVGARSPASGTSFPLPVSRIFFLYNYISFFPFSATSYKLYVHSLSLSNYEYAKMREISADILVLTDIFKILVDTDQYACDSLGDRVRYR